MKAIGAIKDPFSASVKIIIEHAKFQEATERIDNTCVVTDTPIQKSLDQIHEILHSDLVAYYDFLRYNIKDIFKSNFKSKFDDFYSKCLDLFDAKPVDKDYKNPSDIYNNRKRFLETILLIIYSNLFDLHRYLIDDEIKVLNKFSSQFKHLVELFKQDLGHNVFSNRLRIISFINVCNMVDDLITEKSELRQIVDNSKIIKKLFELVKLEFSHFTFKPIDRSDLGIELKNSKIDVLCNLNIFLSFASETEKLIIYFLKFYELI